MIRRPQDSESSHQWSLDQRFFVAGLAQRLETSQLGIITISYSTRMAALLMFWRGCTQRCRKHGTIRLLSSFYKPRAFKAV